MRDPARIDDVLAALRRLWTRAPDARLGQLLVNAVRPRDPCPELFSIEDDALVTALEQLAEALPPEVAIEIESTFESGGHAYVIGRVLVPLTVVGLHDGAALAGVPVHPWLDRPRALAPDGTPRMDALAMCLVNPGDRSALQPGMRVVLRGAQLAPS